MLRRSMALSLLLLAGLLAPSAVVEPLATAADPALGTIARAQTDAEPTAEPTPEPDAGDGTGTASRRERQRNRNADANQSRDPAGDQAADEGAVDCIDFDTQEEAQAVLDDDDTDPNGLDPNGDGIACSLLPSADDTGDEPLDAPPTDVTGNEARAGQQADGGNRGTNRRNNNDANAGNADAGNKAAADEAAADSGNNRNRNRDRNQNRNNQQNGGADDLDCEDFATQEDAQQALDDDAADPYGLDANQDGQACEEFFDTADNQANDRQRNRNRRNRQNDQTTDQTDNAAVREVTRNYDCVDFPYQEDAQEVYDDDPRDPNNLDPNGDGFACSSLPSRDPTVVTVPRTGVGTAPPVVAPAAAAVATPD